MTSQAARLDAEWFEESATALLLDKESFESAAADDNDADILQWGAGAGEAIFARGTAHLWGPLGERAWEVTTYKDLWGPLVYHATTALERSLIVISSDVPPAIFPLHGRLDELQEHELSALVARLHTSASEPGEEIVRARTHLDFEYVLARLLLSVSLRQAEIWLTSHNSHLRARPIDVFELEGPAPVIEAIDALEQEAYS